MKKVLLSLTVASLLSACGGGGGGGSSGNTPVLNSALLESSPTLLVDVKSKYEALCGNKVNMQLVIPVDMNKDGKMDLLANLWCGTPNGQTNTNPVPNTLLVLTQVDKLKFKDNTAEVFGTDNIDLGGVAHRYVKYDFNNDGYEDIVYAVNMEDGRVSSTTLVQNVAVMSNGNGTYSVVKIGTPASTQNVTLKDNYLGSKDVVMMPSNEVWRYNNGWSKVDTYNWIGYAETVFAPSPAQYHGSEVAFVQNAESTDYSLYKYVDGQWLKNGSYVISGSWVPFLSYTGDLGQTKLFSIDNNDYVIGGVVSACATKRTPNSNYEMIGILVGQQIVGGYTGGTLNENANYPAMSKMVSYGVKSDSTFGRLSLTINNEVQNISPHRMECTDVNDDGYEDIVIYRWGSTTYPIVYLNDKNGSYGLVSGSNFPNAGSNTATGQLYYDLDGDGVKDLLYYPISGSWDDYSTVKLKVFKGQRKIKNSDLQ